MKLIFLFLLLLFIPAIFALDPEVYVKTDVLNTIEFPCYNSSNSKCVAGTQCNITITDPDGINNVNNEATVYNGNLPIRHIFVRSAQSYSVGKVYRTS